MFKIAVIGCGAIGLTSAIEIQRQLGDRVKVTIFTDNKSPNTTGDVAAGLWMPYLLQNTPEHIAEKWAKVTNEYLLKLWKNGESSKTGLSLQLITKVFDDNNKPSKGLKDCCLGYHELTLKQLEQYSNKLGLKLTGGISIVGFTWEASKFLPYFEQKFLENGGEIILRKIESFNELTNYDLIVNCAGLNARTLVPDDEVYPVRGQIIRVKAPWLFETFISATTHSSPYIIPNQSYVILGGTSQKHDYNLNVDQNDKERIMEHCCRIVPGLSSAEVIQDIVGLRPARTAVRLEFEKRIINGREIKIIHNYGHGGSGITLSIGCAEDCAQMAKIILCGSKL